MGSDKFYREERPVRPAAVDAFWMDTHPVTNAQYREFVDATGYLTTAEKPIDWEEMKKQVPPGTPKPPDETLKPPPALWWGAPARRSSQADAAPVAGPPPR